MSSTLFVSNLRRKAHLEVPLDCEIGPVDVNVMKRGCFEHTTLSWVDSVLNGSPWGKARARLVLIEVSWCFKHNFLHVCFLLEFYLQNRELRHVD